MWLEVICWDRILGGNPNCGTVMREKIRNLPTDERDGELTLVEYLDSIHDPWEIHIDAHRTTGYGKPECGRKTYMKDKNQDDVKCQRADFEMKFNT